MAETDIAKRASFDTIRYAQVWEDADILVPALRPKAGETIVSIASAGDNALALLAEGPERVIAIDLNPTQLACVRLRMAAMKVHSHNDFLELMGARASGRRRYLLEQVAPKLSEEDQKFWSARKDEVVKFGAAGVGKFENYFKIFREWMLPFVHNRETIDELLRHRSDRDRAAFYEKYWNIWGWRTMLKVFFSKGVMGKLGRDPAFFDHVKGSPSDHVAALTRKALVEQDPSDNPYLHWILRGLHGEALPRAWTEERYETIRDRLDRLEVRLGTVESLAEEGIKADAFNLSDIFEYMSPEAHEKAYGTILAASRPGARIGYWNMMVQRRVPKAHADKVTTNTELEAKLKPLDKAFFYSDFVIEEVKSNPAVLSTAKIIGSVILLALVLWGVSKLAKIAKLDPEVGRKLVHISLGLYCLVFPFVFSEAWEVWATCVLAVGVFMLARGTMRESLGGGLHSVQRTSYGELLFAASVALLFWLKEGHFIAGQQGKPHMGPVLYVLPILILTLCDAASALVGSRYGKRVFRIEEGSKSVEGVVVFAVTAWLLSLITILLLTNIGRSEAVLLAFIVAVFGALLEAASWRGLDNLFIPMGLYFLLANLLGYGVIGLAMIAGAFFVVLVTLLKLSAGSGANRHVLAAGATLFFCIWIFSGPLSLITPAAAVAAYFLCVRFLRIERPQHDALNLLLVVLAVALAFFVASHLFKMDTIFGFNAAFAALTAGIAARFSGRWIIVSGVALLAWIAMSVRTLWWEGIREETLIFGLIGVGGILLTVILGSSLRERKVDRPWITLGGLSMGIGLISLIGTPR